MMERPHLEFLVEEPSMEAFVLRRLGGGEVCLSEGIANRPKQANIAIPMR